MDLCKKYLPPISLDYYFDIARISFEFVDEYHNHSHLIHDQYVTFLSVAMYCNSKGKRIKPKYWNDKKFLKNIYDISWKSYAADNLNPRKLSIKERKNLLVIVPVGIPGMGKTTFLSQLSNYLSPTSSEWLLTSLSSDKIRRKEINKILKNDQ